MSLDDVDTPTLVIALDAFERNLCHLPDRIAAARSRRLRTPRPTNAR